MRTIEAREIEERGKAFLSALQEQPFGSVQVVGGSVFVGVDSIGDDALYIDAILSDPPSGTDTWPIKDMELLRKAFRDQVRLAELDVIAYLRPRQVTRDAPEDDAEER